MRRCLVLLAIAMVVVSCASWAQEGGLSPKAGAFSESLYTNVYFSFNMKVPSNWNVTWVAKDGPCGNECMLLDARHPAYPKPMQMIQVTAEAVKAVGAREPVAGSALVSMGAKKIGEPKEVILSGMTCYRTDYRSQLANADLFQSLVLLPGKDYAAVFSFAANNRKDLDLMIDDFGKSFSRMGAKQN